MKFMFTMQRYICKLFHKLCCDCVSKGAVAASDTARPGEGAAVLQWCVWGVVHSPAGPGFPRHDRGRATHAAEHLFERGATDDWPHGPTHLQGWSLYYLTVQSSGVTRIRDAPKFCLLKIFGRKSYLSWSDVFLFGGCCVQKQLDGTEWNKKQRPWDV